jgi:hypothetical protein
MIFRRIHTGYWIAVSAKSGDTYVVRTRPLNDGWMSINDDESLVIATGQSFHEAQVSCASYDKLVCEAIVRI